MAKGLISRVTNASDSSDFYTPSYAVDILIPFLKKKGFTYIWECACGLGHITNVLLRNGIYSYQSDAKDLRKRNPDSHMKDFLIQQTLPSQDIQAIITNPPYIFKDEFLKKCYSFNIPFALLMPSTAIGGKFRVELYMQHGIELLIPDKRVNYIYSEDKDDNWFHSAWFCYDILPEKLMFTRMITDDKNSNQNRLC